MINNIKEMAEVSMLGKTFNGQTMPLLTIGNKASEKVVILSARVHPGETVSSHIM
jgi:murein tripeptide amidase MpaA